MRHVRRIQLVIRREGQTALITYTRTTSRAKGTRWIMWSPRGSGMRHLPYRGLVRLASRQTIPQVFLGSLTTSMIYFTTSRITLTRTMIHIGLPHSLRLEVPHQSSRTLIQIRNPFIPSKLQDLNLTPRPPLTPLLPHIHIRVCLTPRERSRKSSKTRRRGFPRRKVHSRTFVRNHCAERLFHARATLLDICEYILANDPLFAGTTAVARRLFKSVFNVI